MVTVNQAYRFALNPTPQQRRQLQSHAGAARFAWNWALARCNERYESDRKWYPFMSTKDMDLQRLWRQQRDEVAPWHAENSNWAYIGTFRRLDKTLKEFVRSRKGQRAGKRVGYPRFKKKGRAKDSFQLFGGPMRSAGKTVTLPKLGTIRTFENTRKLTRRLGNGTAKIKNATVSRVADRWFVSFSVEVERDLPEQHRRPGSAVGVDLGVKTLMVCVDDAKREQEIPGPKSHRQALRKLRLASKAFSRTKKGSANRRKAARRLARLHARVASVRTDVLHKATSRLARDYEAVAVEDLNVTGMLANRRLARAVADQGFYQVRQMLTYKTRWNSGSLTVADRWYPSSKTCSACGGRKPNLTLADRIFTCDDCGLRLDRDVNAATNLMRLAASGAESVNACGGSGSPPLRRGRQPVKQEPGAAVAGEAGTVGGQPPTTLFHVRDG